MYFVSGIVVTVVSTRDELVAFQKLLGAIGGTSQSVNCLPEDLKNLDLWSSSDENFDHIYGIVENTETEEQIKLYQDSTGAESKQERSDENYVINLCDKKKVPVTSICSCNLYDAAPSDIISISGPSLFSISEKEKHWRDVLPVVVNECQIPLNTPLALLDSKFIRIKTVPNRIEVNIENNEDLKNPIDADNLTELCNKINFLTYDEIRSTLENELTEQIDLENVSSENYDILSTQEIENFLENNEAVSEFDYETKNSSIFIEAEKVLRKYQTNRKKLEKFFIAFDSFDIVGWMAVDKIHNIVDNIETDRLPVMEFRVVDCSSGKRHIKVVSSVDITHNGENNFENHFFTFNLNSLNLVQPFSLESIAEKFKQFPPMSEQQKTDLPANNEPSLTFSPIRQVCNIPYPTGKNGCKSKCRVTSKVKRKNSERTVSDTTNHQNQPEISVKTSTKSTKATPKSNAYNYLEESNIIDDIPHNNQELQNGYKRKVKTKIERQYSHTNIANNQNQYEMTHIGSIKSSFSNGSNQSIINHDSQDCHKKGIYSSTCNKKKDLKTNLKQTYKISLKFESRSDNERLQNEGNESSSDRTICHTKKSQGKNYKSVCSNASDSSSELSNKSDTSSSEKLSKRSSNSDTNQNGIHRVVSSSEESGFYVDMTQNLAKWQELHDCEESDLASSTESDVLRLTIMSHDTKHFSDSSSSRGSLHSSKILKPPKPRRNVHRMYKQNSSDSYDTSESVVSNHNSFRTAYSQHLTSREISKEDVYIPPYSHSDPYGLSSNNLVDQSHYQKVDKQFPYNSSLPYDNVLIGHASRRCPTSPKASTSKAYHSFDPYQYPDINVVTQTSRSQNKCSSKNKSETTKSSTKTPHEHFIPEPTINKPLQYTKRLTSNNLFFEWYSTWYTEVRRIASHLENTEYVKMMSARRF